jgi:hypothetical protein
MLSSPGFKTCDECKQGFIDNKQVWRPGNGKQFMPNCGHCARGVWRQTKQDALSPANARMLAKYTFCTTFAVSPQDYDDLDAGECSVLLNIHNQIESAKAKELERGRS